MGPNAGPDHNRTDTCAILPIHKHGTVMKCQFVAIDPSLCSPSLQHPARISGHFFPPRRPLPQQSSRLHRLDSRSRMNLSLFICLFVLLEISCLLKRVKGVSSLKHSQTPALQSLGWVSAGYLWVLEYKAQAILGFYSLFFSIPLTHTPPQQI